MHIVQPGIRRGVAGHAPVAAGADGDAAHLRAVGQARALELLVEEAPHEGAEPLAYGVFIVRAAEGA